MSREIFLRSVSYFSVSYDLIVFDTTCLYDLFVNASANPGNEKYIKVFTRGSEISSSDVEGFKAKYPQLYIPETQRSLFVKSLTKSESLDDVEKTEIIKDSAIRYLRNIFESGREFSTELLSETIEDCREAVSSMVDVLDGHDIKSLHSLIGNLSFHDFYTYDHSINVSMYSISILKTLKPDCDRLELIHAGLGGLLHDLGKIKIPTEILNCPGALTNEQYQMIKQHPDFGLELLLSGHCEVSEEVDIEVISEIIHQHHENWNGTGYPNRLKGEEISYLARICCVADFFDAITTKRSYNEVLNIDEALGVMEKTVERKIDPQVFEGLKKYCSKKTMFKSNELVMEDHFDPTIPYNVLPLKKVKVEKEKQDFGKIKVVDPAMKKKPA